jgi:hypothetical protein
LSSAAEPLDFRGIHVEGLVEADGDTPQPGACVSRPQLLDPDHNPVQDSGYLATLVHRQMDDDLIIDGYSGGAYEQ